MTTQQFEHFVAKDYKNKGYKVTATSISGDYGVDLFAVKGSRKNRQPVTATE